MPLKEKHALITGSSRGIGRGIALKLAERGVKIAIHYYKNEDAANDTLAKVRERGADGFVVQADVSRPENIGRMFEQVQGAFNTLDIFVHNARPELSAFYQPPQDLTLDQWQIAFDSQVQALLLGAREAVRLMPEGGRIIAITFAPSARTGSWQSWVAMGAAKAAQEALVRYLAVMLAPQGITVNSVSPGLTFGDADPLDGTVLDGLPPEVQQSIKAWHESGWTPMGRVGSPADIGNAVMLLCREEASFITGQMIHVDGGASIMDPDLPLEIQRGS